MKKKIHPSVERITSVKLPTINYEKENSISYSQISTHKNCPHRWDLLYRRKVIPFQSTIHTVFGTAIHEVLQEWLEILYNTSVKAANAYNFEKEFENKLRQVYSAEYERVKEHFSTVDELTEFYQDGIEILKYIVKKRASWFSTKYMKLVGCEIPLTYQITEGLYFKGYLDLVFYDTQDDKYLIFDIKTSTSGWNSYAKKDDTKIAQLLLYKEFFAKQYNVEVDKVEIQFFIVKRKVPADPEYPAMARRVQEFKPPSGKIKRGQAVQMLNSFMQDVFTEQGIPYEKEYEKKASKSICRFCEFKGTEFCNSPF